YIKVHVVISEEGKMPKTRGRAIEELTRHNGLQILSIWLLEYGLQTTLREVSLIFANVSQGNPRLSHLDLEDPIQRSLQLLGSDDYHVTFNLIVFLRNVCRISTVYKSHSIDLSVCAELLDVIDKWATASALAEPAKSRHYVNTISITAETLCLLTSTENDPHHVYLKAIESLLKAKDNVIQILMRITTFYFANERVRTIVDKKQKVIASEQSFLQLPSQEQIFELKTK
ncbi:hypothetical protein PMAYCL1PPCAC_10990, partial [Pristionchus mayeri]